MQKKQLNKLAQLLSRAARDANVVQSADLSLEGVPEDGRVYLPLKDGFLGLAVDGLQAAEELRFDLTQLWSPYERQDEIVDRLHQLIRKATEQALEDIEAQLQAANEAAITKTETEVLLPVAGVLVDVPMTLGQLYLRPLTDELRAELTALCPNDEKEQMSPEIYVDWALRDFTPTVASFRASASGLRTLELALAYAEEMLPMLVLAGCQPLLRAEDLTNSGFGDEEQLNAAFLAIRASSRAPHNNMRLAPPGPRHLPAVILNGPKPVQRAWCHSHSLAFALLSRVLHHLFYLRC
ncbi:hypothetical protein CTI14_14540 [Methylobacterium radiotolerans]|nr:hypothetical protein CTI14_14540 [Methylobacterium radiotolerans]